MAVERVRWRNVREFLDDLPTAHCTVKPEHEFCTVCLRINHIVAHDCPLYHQRPKRKTRAPPIHDDAHAEPIKNHLSVDDVKEVLKGEDFPIIEFAGPRGSKSEDEEVLEVEPLEVKPLPTPPVRRGVKEAPKREEPPREGRSETKPAVKSPGPDRDPERIVQEIMEELEFPDEEDMGEEEVPEEDDTGEDKAEGGPGKGEDAKGEETPEESDLDADDGDMDGEAKKGPPPVVVEKEAVKRRRPKQK